MREVNETATIRHIIFDLGNVLIDIHPDRMLAALAKLSNRTAAEIRSLFLGPAHWAYMNGETDFAQFHRQLGVEAGINGKLAEFQTAWNMVIGKKKPGMAKLVKQLKKDYHVHLLSNTDPMHWETACRLSPFLKEFEQTFLSYEMRLRKPDPAIYKQVLKTIVASPATVLFIDDTRENIDAAARLGIQTIHAGSPMIIEDRIGKIIAAENR